MVKKIDTKKDRNIDNVRTIFWSLYSFLGQYKGKPDLPNQDIFFTRSASCCKNFTVPNVFNVFKNYLQNTLGTYINLNFDYVTDEFVDRSDSSALDEFGTENWDSKGVNFDILFQAAIYASECLCYNSDHSFNVGSIDYALDQLPKDTASSFPIFKKKGHQDAIDDALFWINQLFENPQLYMLMSCPTTFYHRFTVKLNKSLDENVVKARLLWGESFRIAILKTMFFKQPLSYSVKFGADNDSVYSALGKNNKQIAKSVTALRSTGLLLLGADVRAFDSHVRNYFFPLYYTMRLFCLNLNNVEFNIYKLLMVFDCYTPYVYRDGKIKCKGKGNASGTITTGDFNTFVSSVVIIYCILSKNGKFVKDVDLFSATGDDTLIPLNGFDKAYVIKIYKLLGFPVSVEKTILSLKGEPVNYLSRNWTLPENAPRQDVNWYVSHICVPGRFVKEKDIPIPLLMTYRSVSICGSNEGGLDVFDRLMNKQDVVWNDLKHSYRMGADPVIKFYNRDFSGKMEIISLAKIFKYGWKAF